MSDSRRTAADAAVGVTALLMRGSPWAIREDLLPRLIDAAGMYQTSPHVALKAMNDLVAAAPEPAPAPKGVAVIPLTGIITPQGSLLSMLFGGAPGGLMGFRDAFSTAIRSPDVSAVVIDVDSPGGLTDLVPETAAMVREARGSKPIVAVADTLMASAAYWIAAQADELVATPSGYAGSVGVYRVHEDWSKADEQAGVKVTYVHAGRLKVEGNPAEPLSEEAEARWQADVDDVYGMFVADVAAGRGISAEQVIANYGEGRSLNAKRALEAGVVDRVATYEDVVSGLLRSTASGTSARRVASHIQTRDEARAEHGLAPIEDGTAAAPADDSSATEAEHPDLTADERLLIAALLTA